MTQTRFDSAPLTSPSPHDQRNGARIVWHLAHWTLFDIWVLEFGISYHDPFKYSGFNMIRWYQNFTSL